MITARELASLAATIYAGGGYSTPDAVEDAYRIWAESVKFLHELEQERNKAQASDLKEQ